MGKPFSETFIGGLLTKKGTDATINTIISPILDKVVRSPDGSFIKEKIKDGKSISHKRLLNLGGTGSIIAIALSQIVAEGSISWQAVALVLIGVGYSLVMAHITKESEKQ